MNPSAIQRAILERAIDYAGLFPPATLSMAEAVRNYALYATSEDSWALGRFVLPVARMGEFEEALQEVDQSESIVPWRLAAVCGADVVAEAVRIAKFNEVNGAKALVDTVECRTAGIEEIETLARMFPAYNRFAEVAIGDLTDESLRAVSASGSYAKIRTGGVIAGAVPPSAAVLNFIQGCQRSGTAFKATAGLHHLHRGSYRLTYESDSPEGTMFGYLNIIGAAAAAYAGRSDSQVRCILEADDSGTLVLDERGMEWNGVAISRDEIEKTRNNFMFGFGSCSFREPMDEMGAMVERTAGSSGDQ